MVMFRQYIYVIVVPVDFVTPTFSEIWHFADAHQFVMYFDAIKTLLLV